MSKRTSVRKSIKQNPVARNIWRFIEESYQNALERPDLYLEDDLLLAEARLETILPISNRRVKHFAVRQLNKVQKKFIKNLN